MKIVSDFKDFYDEAVESSELCGIYRRINGETLNRKQGLEYLKTKGIATIDCDFAKNIGFWDCEEVVVFTEPNTHNIEKRIKMSKDTAMQYYPNHIVMPFISREFTGGITLKYLKIGRRHWNITLINKTDILTDGMVYSIEYIKPTDSRLETPIWSIDYIKDKDGKWVAIDYNDNPIIGYMDSRLKPQDVLNEIAWFCSRQE